MTTAAANRLPLFTLKSFFAMLAFLAAAIAFQIYLSGSIRKWESNFVRSTPHFLLDAYLVGIALWPFNVDTRWNLRISCAAAFALSAVAKVLLWEMPQLAGFLPFVIMASGFFGVIQLLRYCMTAERRAAAATERRPTARTIIFRVVLLVLSVVAGSVATFYAMILPGEKGVAAMHQKRYDAAIRYFTAEIWLTPVDNPNYYLWRGSAYYHAGRYDAAIADFNIAIRLHPDNSYGYRARGNAWLGANRHTRALVDFNEAIRLDPTSAAAYEGRGRAYLDAGNYQAAVDDLDKASDLDPKLPIHQARGLSYFRLGQFNRAIADFYEALKHSPNDASTYYCRGVAYSAAGDKPRASADFDAASRIVTEAMRKDPGDQNALDQLAWMLATSPEPERRDGKKAVEYACTVAASKNWSDADSLDLLATAYAEAGDFDAAVKWEQKAIELADEPQPRRHERLELFKNKQPFHEK